jgi:hypothetical protein
MWEPDPDWAARREELKARRAEERAARRAAFNLTNEEDA